MTKEQSDWFRQFTRASGRGYYYDLEAMLLAVVPEPDRNRMPFGKALAHVRMAHQLCPIRSRQVATAIITTAVQVAHGGHYHLRPHLPGVPDPEEP